MPTPTLEERVAELEKKVARLLSEQTEKEKAVPWWERHFGAFKDSPYYEEAMRLGTEYRRSQPKAADESANDVSSGH